MPRQNGEEEAPHVRHQGLVAELQGSEIQILMSTVAADLRHGDVVALVGETDEGLIRGRAMVLGSTAPDWYAGELEDGSRVQFRIDQVEGIETPSYGMSGFLDWFKRKPASESKALIPIPEEGGGVIYVGPTGVARYEDPRPKKKGFLKPISEAVKGFWKSAAGMASIFDVFQSKRELIEEPEKEAVKFEKPPSIFTQFIPGEGPGPLAKYVEKAGEIFQYVKPSVPPVPYEERQRKQAELWEGMFEPDVEADTFEGFGTKPEVQEPPVSPFRAEEVVSEKEFAKSHPFDWKRGLAWAPVVMELPATDEMLPSKEDLARAFLTYWGPELFEHTFRERNKAFEDGEEFFYGGIQTLGSGEGIPDYLEGISLFLQIPWEEFEKRDPGTIGYEGSWSLKDDDESSAIYKEIIYPAYRRIEEAFSLITPKELPGEFLVGSLPEEWGNQTGIFYVERNPAYEGKERGNNYFVQSVDWESEDTGSFAEPEEESEEEQVVAVKRKKKKSKKKAKAR